MRVTHLFFDHDKISFFLNITMAAPTKPKMCIINIAADLKIPGRFWMLPNSALPLAEALISKKPFHPNICEVNK